MNSPIKIMGWVQDVYVYGIIVNKNFYMWEVIDSEHPMEMMQVYQLLMTFSKCL